MDYAKSAKRVDGGGEGGAATRGSLARRWFTSCGATLFDRMWLAAFRRVDDKTQVMNTFDLKLHIIVTNMKTVHEVLLA